MPKKRASRRKTSERKLRFYRMTKEFCASHALPTPLLQFKKGSAGYIIKTQTIELDENEKDENFFHALGHHKYFSDHGSRDNIMTRLGRVCLVSGISLFYFERTNPLPLLLLMVPYGHQVFRQVYAEKHVPKELQSPRRWLRLLIPFGK